MIISKAIKMLLTLLKNMEIFFQEVWLLSEGSWGLPFGDSNDEMMKPKEQKECSVE